MARLAVLTDRLPDDPSWKGAYTWDLIRALAESQHEVAVFTTEELGRIEITHPRLTVARPAPSFSVDRLPRWAQALLNYRPEVIHTFALKESTLWPRLAVWPYLDALCKALPGVRRVSTMFEPEDFAEASAWHLGSQRWTVFSAAHARAAQLAYPGGRVEIAPLDDLLRAPEDDEFSECGYVFVPAPVSEWTSCERGLAQLLEHLRARPELSVWINGGWGELSLSARRQGWQTLGDVASRVRLLETQPLPKFVGRARHAGSIWLEGLRPDSWRYLMSAQIGQQLGKELIGGHESGARAMGSTANFLSRIYLS